MTTAATGLVERYDYRDQNGELLFQVCRTPDKQFPVRRPDGRGGWRWGLGDAPRVAYHLQEVREAIEQSERVVFVPEGEKDVECLRTGGLRATTCPGGAGKWRSIHTDALVGCRLVVVLPDNDIPGRDHGANVAASLHARGIPVKVLALPDLPHKGDVSDYFDRGGTVDTLHVLVNAQPFWSPDEELEDGWLNPESLGALEPDAIPLDALPRVLREFVTTVSDATQTPTDLSALLTLTAVSVSVQGKAEIRARGDWREPMNIYGLGILPPASRKSTVFKHVLGPLEAWELEQCEAIAPHRKIALDRQDVLEQRLKTVKRNVANDKATLDEVEAARNELEEYRVPTLPRLNAPGATPEALSKVMAENGGRMATLSPEGDSLALLDGRYSRGGEASLELPKKAWSGEPVRTDRISREGEFIRRPTLTIGLCLQPGVLENLRNVDTFRSEGVFGRFLFVLPRSGIGFRRTGEDVPELDQQTVLRYRARIRQLLELLPPDMDSDGTYTAQELSLTDGARDRLYEFEAEIEADLRPGGRLAHIQDWAGKLVGQTVRLAGLLHMAGSAVGPADNWGAITEETIDQAVRIARALSTHALRLFDELGSDPETRLARRVLRRAREMEEGSTVSQLHESMRHTRGLERVGDINLVLDRLEDGNHLKRRTQPHQGTGRPPSPLIELHPAYCRTIRLGGSRAEEAVVPCSDFSDVDGSTDVDPYELPQEPPF